MNITAIGNSAGIILPKDLLETYPLAAGEISEIDFTAWLCERTARAQ